MLRLAASLALFLSGTALATAQSIDDAITDFIQAKGFSQQDTANLEEALSGHFIDDSITPGGAVGPIEKAIMIADDAIASIRTRSFISYGEIIEDEDGAPVPYSFIEVRHYNLGPAIRADVAEAYGEENTAPVEDFGLGEHMAWRFVFRPIMGHTAMLLDASSRVISEEQASRHDCGGVACLDITASYDALAEWQEIEGRLPEWPLLYSDQSDEVATPAHAIAELAVLGFWANAESGQYQWTGGEHPEAISDATPYRFISIDRHLGQEASIDAVWHETAINDDALASILFRRAEVGGEAYLMRASVER